jgi:hypothetical protein
MMNFADIFPDNIMMQTLGDDVTYIAKGGQSAAIKVIVNYGIQQTFATDAYVPEKHVVIDALKSAVPNVGKGAQFIHKGVTFVVDAVMQDDGHVVQLAVRRWQA